MIATLLCLMSVTLVEHNDHLKSETLQLPTVLYCSNILCIPMDPSLVSDNAVNLFKVINPTVRQQLQTLKRNNFRWQPPFCSRFSTLLPDQFFKDFKDRRRIHLQNGYDFCFIFKSTVHDVLPFRSRWRPNVAGIAGNDVRTRVVAVVQECAEKDVKIIKKTFYQNRKPQKLRK